MKTTHTQTPWTISGIPGDNYVRATQAKVNVAQILGWPGISDEEFDANKQFVVNACNAYESLLYACKIARGHLGYGDCSLDNVRRICDEAITKAEPKPHDRTLDNYPSWKYGAT